MNRSAILLTAVALASASVGASNGAPVKPPVVVELFTSQGCSSCPPANANLIELARRDDVLALSFAVTYWDYLGWKDSFGKPEFTDRQVAYEPPLHQSGPYTPQMVINGTSTAVGINLAEVVRLVDDAAPLAGPSITTAAGKVAIGKGNAPEGGADVWLVQYDPNVVEVPVARGENTGRTLPHTHVVHSLQRLGTWNGSLAAFDQPSVVSGLQAAILVQAPKGGPILAAAIEGRS